MEVNAAKQPFGSKRSSKYLPLCSAEEINSLLIFGWTILLTVSYLV